MSNENHGFCLQRERELTAQLAAYRKALEQIAWFKGGRPAPVKLARDVLAQYGRQGAIEELAQVLDHSGVTLRVNRAKPSDECEVCARGRIEFGEPHFKCKACFRHASKGATK